MLQTKETPARIQEIPTDGSALFVLAHPDDEFMVGGLLHTLKIHEIPTYVLIATDGEVSQLGSPGNYTGSDRRKEGEKALAAYGVQRDQIYFEGLPDSGLLGRYTEVLSKRVSDVLEQHEAIKTLVTLGDAGCDGHPDHKAAHEAAYDSLQAQAAERPDVRLYGLAAYGARYDYEIPVDPALKLRNLSFHRTQHDVDVSNPDYKPVRGTIEVPGIRLSEASRIALHKYRHNMRQERYKTYPLASLAGRAALLEVVGL